LKIRFCKAIGKPIEIISLQNRLSLKSKTFIFSSENAMMALYKKSPDDRENNATGIINQYGICSI